MHCSFPRVPVSASFKRCCLEGATSSSKSCGEMMKYISIVVDWSESETTATYSEFGVFSCVFQHTNAPNLYQFNSSRRQEEEICSLKSQLLPQDNKWPVPDTGSRVRTRANDQYQKPHQPLSGASVLITDPVGPGRLPLLKQQTQLLIYCIELAQISRHSPLHRRH